MEAKEQTNLIISQDTGRIIDFAVSLGQEVMVCGGEMWRVEQVLGNIFKAYNLIETSIYMDIHCLIISGRRRGESHVIRQIQVGDISPELERLTRLLRMTESICTRKPEPILLKQMLTEACGQQTYSPKMQLLGIVGALISINYIVGGSWQDALMAVAGICFFRLCDAFFSDVPGTNYVVLHAITAFAVGLVVSFLTFRMDFRDTPYMAIIVMAFGLIPGLPLINACREIFCGRVLCSVQLFMQSFVETAVVVSGFAVAIGLIGGW